MQNPPDPNDGSGAADAAIPPATASIRWTGTRAVLHNALTRIDGAKTGAESRRIHSLERLIDQLGDVEIHFGSQGISVRFDRNRDRDARAVDADGLS